MADMALKTYLLALEAADSSCFGPVQRRPADDDGYLVKDLATAAARELVVIDLFSKQLSDLATLACGRSGTDAMAFSLAIGTAITSAFVDASRRQVGSGAQASMWRSALAAYLAAYAAAERASVEDSPGADALMDACCAAMDFLIEHVPAPNLAALATKVRLAEGRANPFEDVPFEDHARGIVATSNGSRYSHRAMRTSNGWRNGTNSFSASIARARPS